MGGERGGEASVWDSNPRPYIHPMLLAANTAVGDALGGLGRDGLTRWKVETPPAHRRAASSLKAVYLDVTSH